jgi:shikimate 5-dehydrogenase
MRQSWARSVATLVFLRERGTKMGLEGRSAIVTGAGRGLGRAITLALTDQGARVTIMSRSSRELEETANLQRLEPANTVLTPLQYNPVVFNC